MLTPNVAQEGGVQEHQEHLQHALFLFLLTQNPKINIPRNAIADGVTRALTNASSQTSRPLLPVMPSHLCSRN